MLNTTRSSVGSSSLQLTASNNQYVNLSPLSAIGTNGISFSVWFSSNGSGNNARIMEFSNGVNSDNIAMYISNNNLGLYAYKSGSAYGNSNVCSSVNQNQWTHAVWTMDASGGVWKCYVNGALVYTSTLVYPDASVVRSQNFIGKSASSASDPYFNGSIDEFKVYRKVLTQVEVTSLYMNNVLVLTSGMLLSYHCDLQDTTTNAIYNYVTSAYDSLVGAPSTSATHVIGDGSLALNYSSTSPQYIVPSAVNFGSTSGFTMCMWVKNTYSSTNPTTLFNFTTGPNAANATQFSLTSTSVKETTNGTSTTNTISSMDGEWHHITIVFGNTSTRKVYIDGVLQVSYTGSPYTSNANGSGNAIGYGWNATDCFNGMMDDVRLYNSILDDNSILTVFSNRVYTYTVAQLRVYGYSALELRNATYADADIVACGYTVAQLKDAGFTPSQLRTSELYSDSLILNGGFAAGDMRTAGFNASELKSSGYTASQLRVGGYSVQNLQNANYSDADILGAGYTASELKDRSYRTAALKTAGYTASQMYEAGYDAGNMYGSGFTMSEIRLGGYTLSDLRTAAYPLADILAAGYDATTMKNASYTAAQLFSGNYSVSALQTAGYAIGQIILAGYNGITLRLAGYLFSELKFWGFLDVYILSAGYTATVLKAAYSATQLKTAGYTAADLYTAGFTVAQLKAASYTDSSIITAGYTATLLKQAGYTATQLKSQFTIAQLIAGGYLANDIINAGITANLLQAAGYTIAQLKSVSYSDADILSAGYTATALLAAGYTATNLCLSGYTIAQLKVAKYTDANILAAGFSATNLLAAGYTARQLQGSGGYTASDAKTAGYADSDILAAGFSAGSLNGAGYTISQVLANGYTASQAKTGGYMDSEILTAGFPASQMLSLYTATQMRIAAYTPQALSAGGYSVANILQAGYSASVLFSAGYTVGQLSLYGYTPAQLKAGGFSDSNVLSGGFSADTLRTAGYSAAQLYSAGYTAIQLKTAGFVDSYILTAGYTATQLKAAGYTASQLFSAGIYTIDNLKSVPYTSDQIINAGYSATLLKTAGYSATQLVNAFTPAQLQSAGYSDASILAAGYSATALFGASYTASQLLSANFTVNQLKTGGYSDANILAAGYTVSQLLVRYSSTQIAAAGYTIANFVSAGSSRSVILSAGFSASSLKAAQYTATELRVAAYAVSDLQSAGYSDAAIWAAGYSAAALFAAGYSAANLFAAGYTASSLRVGGFADADILAAGYTIAALKLASYYPVDIKAAGYADADIISAGFAVADLNNAGYTASQLYNSQYSAAGLKTGGYSDADILSVGYTASQLKLAGYVASDLLSAEYTATQLREANFSVPELQTAGYTNEQILGAGYLAIQLLTAGYSAADLKGASYTALQLKNAGFQDSDILTIGYNAESLSVAGYTVAELRSYGYSDGDLLSALSFVTEIQPQPITLDAVSAANSSAVVEFTDTNVVAIVGYKYSINGTDYNWCSSTTSPVTITGLSNGSEYTITMVAVSAGGQSTVSNSLTVTPGNVPNAPYISSLTASAGALKVSFITGATNGYEITKYYYALDGGSDVDATADVSGNEFTISELANGQSYSVTMKTENIIGKSSASFPVLGKPVASPAAPVINSIVTGDGMATVNFTLGDTNGGNILFCGYSLDGTNYAYTINTTSPLEIYGLTNGYTYHVTIKTVSIFGFSEVSNSVEIAPTSIPSAPVIIGVTPAQDTLVVKIIEGNTNGSASVDYYYSLNGGAYVLCDPPTNSNITIYNLTTGLEYTILLKAKNSLGYSAPSNSYKTLLPKLPPVPIITSVVATNSSASVNFTTSAVENASSIICYKYTLNNEPQEYYANNTRSPILIYGLTNNTNYTIKLKGVTSIGETGFSLSSPVFTPYGFPDAPVILSTLPGNGCAIINLAPLVSNGSPITKISYFDGLNYVDLSGVSTTMTIPGLTNAKTYNILLVAYNIGGVSRLSNMMTVTPGTTYPPVITSVVPGKTNSIIYFTAPSVTNGAAVTQYLYNNGSGVFTKATGVTSPITVTGLINGKTYAFNLAAVNAYGTSVPSNTIGNIVPYTTPATPLISSLTPFFHTNTTSGAVVAFNPPLNNGSDITKYWYNTSKNATFYECSGNVPPLSITGLPLNTGYTLKIMATNAAGNSLVSAASKVVIYTYAVPSQVKVTSVTTGYKQLVVLFTPPANNGAAITTYLYSLNGGAYVDSLTSTPPLVINDISNNTPYNLQVIAVNGAGNSVPSTLLAKPVVSVYLPPLAPKILNIIGNDQSLDVYFTPSVVQGAPVSSYYYSFNAGNTLISANSVSSPFTITGLTNGNSYSVSLAAGSLTGFSPVSAAVVQKPILAVPNSPTILSITPGNASAIVNFTPGLINGSAISNYAYSTNGITYVLTGSTSNPMTITGLQNNTLYNITIAAVNAVGMSKFSTATKVTPIYAVPSSPVITSVTVGTGSTATVIFNASASNGGTIQTYFYTFDGGATLINSNSTTSPIKLGYLTKGQSYTIQVIGQNELGNSPLSNSKTFISS